MGGRGARLGRSLSGKKYGTEYHTALQRGNIKFVKSNSGSANAPMETMSKGRIYVTVNSKDKIKAISFYDRNNKRRRQIDVSGNPHLIDGKKVLPHVHKGYFHNENGDRILSKKEMKLLAKINRIWDNRNR